MTNFHERFLFDGIASMKKDGTIYFVYHPFYCYPNFIIVICRPLLAIFRFSRKHFILRIIIIYSNAEIPN